MHRVRRRRSHFCSKQNEKTGKMINYLHTSFRDGTNNHHCETIKNNNNNLS